MPTVLVTGANRGLGLEFTRQYSRDGWEVIACARNPEKADALKSLAAQSDGRISVHALDVTDFKAVDSLASQLKGRAIDVLLNSAGVMIARDSFGSSNYDEWENVFRVNVFAPMKISEAFVDHVARSEQKKIICISSMMGSVAQNTLGGFYAYRASKGALNVIARSMSLDLGRKHGIIVAPVHPGWVRTDMGGPRADIDVETSVSGMREVIAGLTPERAGRFWAYDGRELPW